LFMYSIRSFMEGEQSHSINDNTDDEESIRGYLLEGDIGWKDRMLQVRNSTYLLFHGKSKWSHYVDWIIMVVVFVNVISFILSTEKDLMNRYSETIFSIVESTSVAIFTVEYMLRFWSSAEKKRSRQHREWVGRLRFVFSFMSVIDLASIIPFLCLLNSSFKVFLFNNNSDIPYI